MKARCIQNGIDHPSDLRKAKTLCAGSDRSKSKIMDLPLKRNGFVIFGYHEIYGANKVLLGIGFDTDTTIDLGKLKEYLGMYSDTFIVQSASGGYHFYFVVPMDHAPKGNDDKTPPNDDLRALGVKEIDFKRFNQIFFAPGTCFCGDKHYTIIQDKDIPYEFPSEEKYWEFEHKLCPILAPKKEKRATVTEKHVIDIEKVAALIHKNNAKHLGSHAFWLALAHFFQNRKVAASDAKKILAKCVEWAPIMVEEVDVKDRLREIDDAYAHPSEREHIDTKWMEEADGKKLEKLLTPKITKEEKEPYLMWEEYYHDILQYESPLIYISELEQWARYDDASGRYIDLERDAVKSLICKWADERQINTKTHLRHIMERTQIMCAISEQSTKHFPEICMRNCILNIKTREVTEHDSKKIYYKSHVSNRNYSEEIVEMPDEWVAMLQTIVDDDQRAQFVQFIINMCHYYLSDESFVVLFGKKRGGKGTILNATEMLIEGCVGHTQMADLGSRFGLWGMYNKWANIVKELSGRKWDDNAITAIKTITGRDGELEIEGKNTKQFNWNIECFLISAANYLPRIKVNDDSFNAIMSRLILIEIPNTLKAIDVDFKDRVISAKIADQMFSWCIQQEPKIIIPKTLETLDDYSKKMWITWQKNSNVIAKAIVDLFAVDKTLDDAEVKPKYTLYVNEVIAAISEQLEQFYDVPEPEDSVGKHNRKQDISECLAGMGIRRSHDKYYYIKYLKTMLEEKDIADLPEL